MTEQHDSGSNGDQRAHSVQPFDVAPPTAAPMLNGEPMPSMAPPLDFAVTSTPPVAYSPGVVPQSPAGTPARPQSSGSLAIAAFVFGVLAVITSFVGLAAFTSWIFGLPAFIMGIVALVKRTTKRGLAVLAIVFSVIAFFISIVVFSLSFTALVDDAIDEVDGEPAAQLPIPGDGEEGGLVGLTVTETALIDEGDFWTYFATVENTDDSATAPYASFTVEAYDAEGVLLDSSTSSASLIPGATVALTGAFFDVGNTEIASLEILMEDYGLSEPNSATGALEPAEPHVDHSEYETVVSGNVSSTFDEDREYVTVIAVARDADGTVVAVNQDMIERVPAGAAARYEVTLWDLVVDDAMTFEVYATP